jgi:hypothetical protein
MPMILASKDSSSCPPSAFDFFPPDTTNIPGGWTRDQQEAAGNPCVGHLFPVVVQGIPKPLLHFLPKHALLTPGSAVPVEYLPRQPTAGAESAAASERRALLGRPVLPSAPLLSVPGPSRFIDIVLRRHKTGSSSSSSDDTDNEGSSSGSSSSNNSSVDVADVDAAWVSDVPSISNQRSAAPEVAKAGAKVSTEPEPKLLKSDSTAVKLGSTAATSGPNDGGAAEATKPLLAAQTLGSGDALESTHIAGNSTALPSGWQVKYPGRYTWHVSVNGKLWYRSGVWNASNNAVPQVKFDANATEGRRDVFDPTIFKEVRCCCCWLHQICQRIEQVIWKRAASRVVDIEGMLLRLTAS